MEYSGYYIAASGLKSNFFAKIYGTGTIDGGVFVAVKESLKASQLFDLERDGAEFIVIQLRKARSPFTCIMPYVF